MMITFKSANRILRKLPRENAFYFFTSIGNYTGVSADSLEEFVKKILEVNIKSLEFHLNRGDFQKWIDETLEDKALSDEVKKLQLLKPVGNDLRDNLYLMVSRHYEKLRKASF
jgi:MoaA/NifB/PqqE/SkfB family radical SAM enzyme